MKKLLLKGFSLIELLIVISVFGILAGFLLTNLSDARMRARDSRAKSELNSVSQALSLYLNTYNKYPAGSSLGTVFKGCGPNGTSSCTDGTACSSADFAAGGTDGCDTTFMTKITKSGSYFFFKYYSCDGDETYRMKYSLENKSDPEINESQARCPKCGSMGAYKVNDYVVCP